MFHQRETKGGKQTKKKKAMYVCIIPLKLNNKLFVSERSIN